MKWSFKIARIGGIDVKIHATFPLLLVWVGWTNYVQAGSAVAIQGIIFILALFFCVLLHEFGHAFAAKAFGIRTPDITLLPIGGVARLERLPENPIQELIIAIAGPAVNVVIIGVLFLFGGEFRLADFFTGRVEGDFATSLQEVNFYLIAFNMIPAFPMDGGRVLRALLAIRLSYAKATAIAARIGQGIAVIFAIVGFFGIPGIYAPNTFLCFIALFVFMAAQQENAYFQMREAARNPLLRDLMLQKFRCMPVAAALQECGLILLKDQQPIYPVVDNALGVKGMVTREVLMQAAREQSEEAPLVDIMRKDIPLLSPEASLLQGMDAMQQHNFPAISVVNPSGQIVGLILLSQLVDLSDQ
ncbi:MAG: site-2 protease family protein [Chthoniobacterales bacterium]